MPARFWRKVVMVFPSPLRMLDRVPPRYRKGQIHARMTMNSPASELENRRVPNDFPKKRKTPVKKIPRSRLPWIVFSTARRMRF